jgi:transposase
MKGSDTQQDNLFSYVSPDERVPKNHPLRKIKTIANKALHKMSKSFDKMYAKIGRPSIPPEKLIRALLLQILYTIRSERLLMEQMEYNLLFRWFVGLSMEDEVWDHSVFSKNRDRFINSDLSLHFFEEIKEQAEKEGLLSDEHFTVDGTLIEAWASLKSFVTKEDGKDGPNSSSSQDSNGRNEEVDFHGEKRTNETHQSKTDPESRLYRKGKGKEAKLSYMGHVLMENRNGLVVGGYVSMANGKAEREAALALVDDIGGQHRITVGADKGYDEKDFILGLREMNATPHVAKKKIGKTIDRRTIRHEGYSISQRKRKRVEEIFGWMKTVGLMRKVKHRGKKRIALAFQLNMSAYNMVRMGNLIEA